MNPLYRQYGNIQPNSKIEKNNTEQTEKKISRQIGGMKAQGVTSISVDINGNLVALPKMNYVELLEAQIRELRNTVQNFEKILIKTNNRIQRLENKITHEQNIRKY